jgi:predicted transcriptional regulator
MNGEPIMMFESSERNAKVLKEQMLELINKIYDRTAYNGVLTG